MPGAAGDVWVITPLMFRALARFRDRAVTRAWRSHRQDPERSLVSQLSQPPHPLPASPDPVGDYFPVGDLTANMVVNPPTGKKSPRSFSHHPGTNPASSPRARKLAQSPQTRHRHPHPAQARPGNHPAGVQDRHPPPRLTSRNWRQPVSVISQCSMITETGTGCPSAPGRAATRRSGCGSGSRGLG